MTRDEIIRMARAAQLAYGTDDSLLCSVEKFFKAAYEAGAAAEREECAKIAQQTICDTHIPTGVHIYGSRVAAAIRARGKE
jgi:hypothetical protein